MTTKRRPLFDIVNDLINTIVAADGEVTDAIDALELELNDKAEAYVAVIRQLDAEACALDELAHEYSLRGAKRSKAADDLKQRLAAALTRAGVERITGATAKAYFATSTRLELDDREAFVAMAAERFLKHETAVDMVAVKRALQDGEAVPGARLTQRRYLRIG